MEFDLLYTLPLSHPLKILHLAIFVPAVIAASIYVLKHWRSKSWRSMAALLALLLAHTAYVIIAPRFYFGDRWYAPQQHSDGAGTFTDDPTQE